MKKNYIITENTNYLREVDNDIIINDINFELKIRNNKIKNIINDSCLYFGSTFIGRREGSKKLLNDNYKLPIVIKEENLLVAFPLNSLRSNKCIWVIYNNILEYYQISKSKVLVEFKNGNKATFHVSYYIFHNQVLKSSRLFVIYKCR